MLSRLGSRCRWGGDDSELVKMQICEQNIAMFRGKHSKISSKVSPFPKPLKSNGATWNHAKRKPFINKNINAVPNWFAGVTVVDSSDCEVDSFEDGHYWFDRCDRNPDCQKPKQEEVKFTKQKDKTFTVTFDQDVWPGKFYDSVCLFSCLIQPFFDKSAIMRRGG